MMESVQDIAESVEITSDAILTEIQRIAESVSSLVDVMMFSVGVLISALVVSIIFREAL